MKILFDARWILVENRFDGVSRYSHELAHAMAARDDTEITWLIHDMRQLEKLPTGNYLLANDPNDIVKETFQLARTINSSGHTLVYSPFFMIGTLGKKYRLILTIHDMIYFKHRTPPQWLAWHVRFGWWLFHLTYWPMRWQLNRADAIATVSATARKELIDARATKRDIMTVSNAVGDTFARYESSSVDRASSKSIVYMGAFTPYKNVECLIDALALLPDMTLVLCGKMPPVRRTELEVRMKKNGVFERVVILDGATDDQYREALSQARCSISASRIEGFGLPILEAQAMGTPFVAADTPIFHEVGDESVLFFNPDSPEEAAAAIRSLANPNVSTEIIQKGYQNAARYTWQNSAAAAMEVVNKVKHPVATRHEDE